MVLRQINEHEHIKNFRAAEFKNHGPFHQGVVLYSYHYAKLLADNRLRSRCDVMTRIPGLLLDRTRHVSSIRDALGVFQLGNSIEIVF